MPDSTPLTTPAVSVCPINARVYNVCNFALRVHAHGLDLARAQKDWHVTLPGTSWRRS